ncbi:MAG: polyphenol oxidase family protein, partial [Salinivirgaceae bacterium]|nr:polyphenol oxidase family protein [Salinivirgaceae bacterium]
QFTQAHIGPCISQQNYEVGKNVFDAFYKLNLELDTIFTSAKNNDKFMCDIADANRQLLIKSGLSEDNIIISGECTYDNAERYYSARRDGFNTGRMVSGIVLI